MIHNSPLHLNARTLDQAKIEATAKYEDYKKYTKLFFDRRRKRLVDNRD